MTRKLAAVLASRVASTRLYAKPMQNISVEPCVSILQFLIEALRTEACISSIVVAIADSPGNEVLVELARGLGVDYIVGSEGDVLERHILAGQHTGATDVLRISSESPFPVLDLLQDIWSIHMSAGHGASFLDNVIDGVGYEILSLDALVASHEATYKPYDREHCSQYIRRNHGKFSARQVEAPGHLDRRDLRLTVDYPEDLVVCRKIYENFKGLAPLIPVSEIISFLDKNPDLVSLIAPYTEAGYASMFAWGEGE